MGKKSFAKKLSVLLAAALVGFNLVTVSASAAEPSVVVSASQELMSTEGMTIVSDPRITGLEKPRVGRNLDQEAIVRTYEGVSWNIPVIWLNEYAETATTFEEGKEYLPTFAFYLPEGIAISGENGYSVKLPEFVRDIYGEDDIISVVSPQAKVIYITSAKLAEAGSHDSSVSNMEKGIAFSDASIENTYISKRNVFSSELSDPGSDSVSIFEARNSWNNQNSGSGSGWSWSSSRSSRGSIGNTSQSGINSGYTRGSRSTNGWSWSGSQSSRVNRGSGNQSWTGSQSSRVNRGSGSQSWTGAQSGSGSQSWTGSQSGRVNRGSGSQSWTGSQGSNVTRGVGGQSYSGAQTARGSSSYTSQGSRGSQNVWGQNYGSQNNGSNTQSTVDLVSTHCTSKAIQKIGKNNLDNLVHIVRDVIEPQAVYQLTSKFEAYSQAAGNGELGKNIGFYIYSASADNDADWRNIQGTYSYVAADYSDGSVRYFIGVNADNVFHRENGSYVLNDNAFEMLSITMTHELMHAFMFDYTAAGMVGLPSDGNEYPRWFVEGMASTVDSGYGMRKNAYNLIQNSAAPDEYDPYTYSEQAILSFFNNTNTSYGNARLDNDNPDGDNRARDYVTGYLACMYLGYMAAENAGLKPEKVEWGVVKFDADVIRAGLDIILEELHSGKSLNTVIGDVSNGAYSGLDDFEERFLKATDTGSSYVIDDENKNSLDFTKEFLNYLDFVSDELTGNSSQQVRASGSVLIPFDSKDQTIIKEQVPSNMPQQSVYVISNTSGFVNSTVGTDTIMASGGAYENGHGEISSGRMSVAAMAIMDGEESGITDETKDDGSQNKADSADIKDGEELTEEPESQELTEGESVETPKQTEGNDPESKELAETFEGQDENLRKTLLGSTTTEGQGDLEGEDKDGNMDLPDSLNDDTDPSLHQDDTSGNESLSDDSNQIRDEFEGNGEQPVVEQPVESVAEQSAEPVAEQSAEPVVEQPVEPAVEQPVEPVVEQPVEPVVEQPVVEQPVVEQPAEPVEPVEPVVEQPVVEQPVEPIGESTRETEGD